MIADDLTMTVRVTGCIDPVFLGKAASSLAWLPEHGMGYLPVTDSPYDADYFAKYQGYAETQLGQDITAARLDLVRRYLSRRESVCDVGIGCGDFLKATCFHFLTVGGWDVNPLGLDWLGLRNMRHNPYLWEIDALTFWDSLEHIPDVHRMIANARRWVFCSLPIVPGDGPPSPDWKHLRRDEHCWYFTRLGFVQWMDAQGFDCDEVNNVETRLGREDIETFVFRRRSA